jgi:hypothetical protein
MTRRFHIAKNNYHGVEALDEDNEALKAQVKALKEELAGINRDIQYEYTAYQPNSWSKEKNIGVENEKNN